MSIHPSLSSKDKGKRSRSVLKRFERLKELQEKEKWKPEKSIFGLPKLKALRWKTKKVKKSAEAEAAAGKGTPEAAGALKGKTASTKKERPTKK